MILKSDKGHDSITFLDAEKTGEIMIPADHKLAFTVGDTSPISSRGPTVDGRFKPNYFIRDSKVEE